MKRATRRLLVIGAFAVVAAAAGGRAEAAPTKDAAVKAAQVDTRDTLAVIKSDADALRRDPERRQFRHHYDNLLARLRALATSPDAKGRQDKVAFIEAQLLADIYAVSRIDADRRLALQAYLGCADKDPRSNLADDALLEAARLSTDVAEKRKLAERVRAMGDRADMHKQAAELLAGLPAPPSPLPDARRLLLAAERSAQAVPERETPPDAQRATGEKPSTVAPALSAGPTVVTPKARLSTVEVLPDAPPAGTASRKIMVIRHDRSADESTVVLRVSGDVGVVRGEVPIEEGGPRRVFYDVAPAKLGQRNVQPIEIHDGVVARVRAGQYDTNVVRLVVELEGEGEPELRVVRKPFEVRLTSHVREPAPASAPVADARALNPAPSNATDAGLVTTTKTPPVAAPAATPTTAAVETQAAAAPPPAAPPPMSAPPALSAAATDLRKRFEDGTPGGVSFSQQLGLAVHRVVIDAGHGGSDTGAIGPSGVKEKDITLQLALRVRDKLVATMPDVEVILTRTDDRTLALQDRTNTANTSAADLFISIHCNASPLRRVRGVETYTLNITHDRYAMKLAARENAETGEGSISDLDYILADLAMKSNVDDSVRLGRSVQRSVVQNLRKRWNDVPDLGLKHALFYVLMGNRMPSILVETSFLSNKTEEQRLASAAYQESVADGIVRGVHTFVEERQAFYQP